MAVATQTRGRNLEPYRRLHSHDAAGVEVLITPALTRLAPSLRVSTRRWVTKGFHVEFPGAPGCDI